MDVLSNLLTDQLWEFSTGVGYGLAVIFVIVAAASNIKDDRSLRRLLVVIIGLIIAVALIGQEVVNPDGFLAIFLTVMVVIIATSLLFELVSPLDNLIGRISKIVSKITLRLNVFLVLALAVVALPFSYVYLYGFSYPPCGLNISEANFLGGEIPAFEGDQVAYLTWTKGGRFDHKADFCAPIFDGTKGEIAETLLPEVYENNKRQTTGYRMESPIEQGEVFKTVSIVSVECGAGACRDFDEGMYYVLQNSSNELWVASADAISLLR